MNKKRLLKLADLLDADAADKKGIKFDIGTFASINDLDKPMSCGTQACALGLAALSGAFKRAGLAADLSGGQFFFSWHGQRTMHGFEIAKELFGIDANAAGDLFGTHALGRRGTGASAERRLAKKLRKFVEAR